MTTPGADEPELFVFGAGGHGRVVADLLLASGRRIAGFVDDRLAEARGAPTVLGLPVLSRHAVEPRLAGGRGCVALGIGDNVVRARVAGECLAMGAFLVTAVHPRAVVSPFATLADGVVVMALAVLNPSASVGRGAIVNTAAVIEHDVVLGEFSHVSPNAALAGAAALGAFSHLGVGASVLPGVRIGDHTVVGGGAVVARELPSRVVAVGVPARVRRER